MKMHNIHFENIYTRFICFFILFNGLFLTTAFGQNIPDANFADAIRTTCPTCIDGSNNLTSAASAQVSLDVRHKNITNLTGIAGFTHLQYLYCEGNQLTSLPTLPTTLTHLECTINQLTSLPVLPTGLTYLLCYSNRLTSLPTLPTGLVYLDCSGNQLTNLPTIPNSVRDLVCNANRLTSLPTLPTSLSSFNCAQNQLTSLPTLPNGIRGLRCYQNQLTSLPTLPNGIIGLYCSDNQLTSLPDLPNSLEEIFCDDNQLTSFQTFPTALTRLSCSGNLIYCLPRLPNNMMYLSFDSDKITCLPNIPTNVVLSNVSGNIDKTTFPICPGPTITTHPSVTTVVCLGNAVTLTARATSNASMTVNWQRVDANDVQFIDVTTPTPYVSGTDATYTFTPIANNNGAKYRAVFSDRCVATATDLTTLTMSTGVHIPNANFAAAIRLNCPTCIDACDNLTAAAANLANLGVNNSNISDLTGIEGFTNLRVLLCDLNQLTTLPTLPSGLTQLSCNNNALHALPNLPSGLFSLDCSDNPLGTLPELPSSLVNLFCNSNQLTTLPILPRLMLRLRCVGNSLTSLPVLPTGLIELYCSVNQITSLPTLPSTLQQLLCAQNNITCFPNLPSTLTLLRLDASKITCLPNLPTNVNIYDGHVGGLDLRNTYALCITPSIITHPSAPSLACSSVTLTARASGGSNMTVKWQRAAQFAFEYIDITTPVAYTSGTAATHNITPVAADQRAQYRAVFTSQCNEVATSAALLILPIGIHIPDANFAAAIRADCPTCIDACDNLTPIAEITTSLNVANRSIQNLTGIAGFTTLTQLICSQNQLATLPTLPTTLTYLSCDNNALTSLPSLPTTLQILYIDHNQLTTLPTLPTGLTQLYANHNQLTSLPSLPNTLTLLNCHFNQLPSLPTLSSALTLLTCNNNLITQLPTLPNNLSQLYGNNNQLQTLPTLPSSLTQLICHANNIYCLTTLPTGLLSLSLDASKITCLPNFPTNVVVYNQNTGANLRNTYALCNVPSNVTPPSVSNPVCVGNTVTLTASVTTNSFTTVKWQRQRTTDMSYVDISTASPYTSGAAASIDILVAANDNGAKYQAVFANCVATTVTASATFQFSTGIAVPDANFVNAIRNQCAYCLDNCGNVTPAAAALTTLNVSSANITNLAGIEGFTGLTSFYCDYNSLTSLPNNLPSSLTTLSCTNTLITTLPTLPSGLTILYCGSSFLNSLPATLPSSLRTLDCQNAYLTALPSTLPSGLLTLNCKNNQLTALPTDMPFTLTEVNCDNNALTILPVFSSALRFLYCRNNQITNLLSVPFSSLSSNLRYLYCSNNRLTSLPDNLPGNILEIDCYDNNMYCLPTLPNSLTNIKLDKLKITCLPNNVSGLVIQNRDISGDISSTYTLCTAPSIVIHPSVSGSPRIGQPTIFTVKATNNSVTSVKWQRRGASETNFSDIANSSLPYTTNTMATYTTPNLTTADVGASYRAVFTSQCLGDATTNAATLNIGVLPVELTEFMGKAAEKFNALTWSVATQHNFSHFIVERTENDTKSWTAIGQVAAQNNSDYQFDDQQPLPLAYYRLTAVDLDGSVSYSKTVSIDRQTSKNQKIKIYPNPATSDLTIEIPQYASGVEIINAIGQVVFKAKTTGKNEVRIDINTWQSGIYFIRTTDATSLIKFIKN